MEHCHMEAASGYLWLCYMKHGVLIVGILASMHAPMTMTMVMAILTTFITTSVPVPVPVPTQPCK